MQQEWELPQGAPRRSGGLHARAGAGASPQAVDYSGLCWPAREQRELLRVLFAPREVAIQSYPAWRAQLDLDTLDSGSLNLMPLLYRRLLDLGLDDDVLPLLRGAHRFHWCKNQVRLRQCFTGVDALLAAGCTPLALKGLAILERYPDVGLRPMSDVDLLVPRRQAQMALDALLADGWTLTHGLERDLVMRKMGDLHGIGLKKNAAELDLHWASLIEDLSPNGDAELWRRAEPRVLQGRKLLVPCATDLMLHTSVHGARFSLAMSVTWVPDCATLIQAPDLDWSLLVAEAKRRAFQVPLRETLRFLEEELSLGVPPGVIEQLDPPEPSWLFWFEHHLFANPRDSTTLHRAAARAVARLRRGQPLPANVMPAPPTTRSARG